MTRNKSRELLIKDGHAVTTDPAEPVPPIELQQREVLHLTPDPLACAKPDMGWDGWARLPLQPRAFLPWAASGPPPAKPGAPSSTEAGTNLQLLWDKRL